MIEKYQEHIKALSKQLGCRIDLKPNQIGMMYVEFGYVEGPTIKTQVDYLVNLHELGHFAHGHTQGRPPKRKEKFYFENGVLKSEAQAWEWALDRCIDEIQDESRRFMWDTCLGSYYVYGYLWYKGVPSTLGNGNRHYVEFVYDHPDEYFESIMKRIQGNLSNWNHKYKGKL